MVNRNSSKKVWDAVKNPKKTQEKTAPKRVVIKPEVGANTTFKKGNKAAVGHGRPKKIPELGVLLASVLGTDTDDITKSGAHEILEALKKQAKAGNARAAELLMDRHWGKVSQQVDMTSGGEKIVTAPNVQIFNNAPPLSQSEQDIKT